MKKNLPSILVLVLIATMWAVSCKKDPTPTPTPDPDQPTDTITPVVPTKEITIRWNWDAGMGWAPTADSIRYYTDQDSVKHVYIHLVGEYGIGFPINCGGIYAGTFHRARVDLQQCINVDSTEVSLAGSLYVPKADLPNHAPGQEPGMAYYDRDWFNNHGCAVLVPNKTNIK